MVVGRRGAVRLLLLAWAVFAANTLLVLMGTARFFFPNELFEPPSTFRAGRPEEYQEGEVKEDFKKRYQVWVVRSGGKIYALSTVCTHLGCTPNWLSVEEKFKCPCHGSGFRKTGVNFEGPAPRPLERFRVRIAEDGQILVDKGRKYQQEKGQWSDPESYIKVG